MKIKSTEDLDKLIDILDDGDTILVSNKDWNQLPVEFWGGVSSVTPTKSDQYGIRWLLHYGGKTILIKLKEKQFIITSAYGGATIWKGPKSGLKDFEESNTDKVKDVDYYIDEQ